MQHGACSGTVRGRSSPGPAMTPVFGYLRILIHVVGFSDRCLPVPASVCSYYWLLKPGHINRRPKDSRAAPATLPEGGNDGTKLALVTSRRRTSSPDWGMGG